MRFTAHQPQVCVTWVCLRVQIEEYQAQESQLRSLEGEGRGPISALLLQLGSSSPEETQEALQELLNAAAASK